MPRRWPGPRPATAPGRWWCWAATAPSTRWPPPSPAPTAPSPRCPVGRPTCSPAPWACRRTRSAAAEVVAESLAGHHIRPIGLGRVNGRYFMFHTGAGWDAALVEIVERHAELKRYAGHPLFIWAGIRTFTGAYDRRTPHMDVTFDDGEVIEGSYFTLVMNSDPYTFVGRRPFTVCPAADLRSGLSVITMTSLALTDFLPVVIDALRDRNGIRERDGLRIRERWVGSPSPGAPPCRTRSTATSSARPRSCGSPTTPTR